MADSSEVVKFLLASGAKLNAVNSSGDTPRRIAHLYRSKTVIEVLETTKNKLNNELFKAVRTEDLKAIEECLKRGAEASTEVLIHDTKMAIIHYAARYANSKVIDLLLEHDPKLIFELDSKERSALHLTAYNVKHKEKAAKRALQSVITNPYAQQWLHVKSIKESIDKKKKSLSRSPAVTIVLEYAEHQPVARRHSMPS
jgi:ankyrin repeat protein